MMLTENELKKYKKEGYFIKKDLISSKEIKSILNWINREVQGLAVKLLEENILTQDYSNLGVFKQLIEIEKHYPGASVYIHTRCMLSEELWDIWTKESLLDVAQDIVGKNIGAHPVWNLRAKTPGQSLQTVPWHQDTAYLAEGSEKITQLTAWIPLLDVTKENGALELIKSEHTQKLLSHKPERNAQNKKSWYLLIDESNLPDREKVICDLCVGSVLFFNQNIPHRSLPNNSDKIRWSLDLRFQDYREMNGFDGIKTCFPIRPQVKGLDWREWAKINRQNTVKSLLDTTVEGPWLNRWMS